MKHFLLATLFLFMNCIALFGQTCTSIPITVTTDRNFSSLAWTSTGGATCPPSNPSTGNIVVNVANNVTLTMNSDLTFNQNFNVTGGAGTVLFIPVGVDIHVKGNMGDADNNNITYHVNGTLQVDGTLYGKNGNSFIGTGTISGGTLDVKNGGSCGTPCPVYGGFDNCNSGNIALCNQALPIHLISFAVKPVKDAVVLEWTTTMEESFSRFVVQRADEGLLFESIGEVAGRGFDINNIESKYIFTDKAPLLGFNYYRLKAVDLDDSFEYFGPKLIRMDGIKNVDVYPNPNFGDEISLRYNFHPQESDRIVVVNSFGVELFNFPASGADKIVFREKLSPGIYMVRYRSGNMEQVNRIVVRDPNR